MKDFIKLDGIFVLRMITIHSGVLICTEVDSSIFSLILYLLLQVVDVMWDMFLAEISDRGINKLIPLLSLSLIFLTLPFISFSPQIER